MKGIILAGGSGSRLHPITLEVPKPLITIRKKPLVNYNLGLFAKYGIDDVKIIIRPLDRKDYDRWSREYKESFPGMTIDIVEEPEPMGTLGYLFHDLSRWRADENVFVTNGDDIKEIDLNAMLVFHQAKGFFATLALMNMESPDDYGAVVVRDDAIVNFLEKQSNLPSALVSAGMYIISPKAFSFMGKGLAKEKRHLMFEKELFPVLAAEKELGAFVCEGTFFDCGTLERWEKAIREL